MARVAVLRIQVLGPICAWRNGDLLDLGSAAQRAVLGLLALACGRPMPRTEITAWIWHDREPPASAANVIQTHVKHLRRLLEPDRPPRARSDVLRQVGDGYALHVPAFAVDVLLFRQRVAAASGAQRRGQLDHAVELLDEALGLWQGQPLADIPVLATHPKVVALAAERQAALTRYGDVMIAAGRPAEGLPALEEAAAAQPLNESCRAALIRAYHAAGRRGQAFATYHEVRRRLADDLGVDPGPELSAAHAALLREEGSPGNGRAVVAALGPAPRIPAGSVVDNGAERTVPAGARRNGRVGAAVPAPGTAAGPIPEPGAVPGPVPAQLPADIADFIGRAAELDQLDQLLSRGAGTAGSGGPASVVISVVTGTAGVGKTALAVRWAHRVAHLFPDGQLYVNMRGFDAGGVMDTTEAVRRFLDALDVPADRIPVHPDAQVALYRSVLAGRRMLIVLDNARNAAQARPLLPGGPGCLVLVTSRNQLSSLVAAEAAQPLPLDLLDAADARELLARRVGADRAAAEPEAVAEILGRCAGLPLALAVVAARAATSPNLPLTALAHQLRRNRDRLDALSTGDPSTDLRAVLSWSYQALSARTARLFRLLGLHPGPDISGAAVTSLSGLPAPQVRAMLAELVRVNLLGEHTPGRYVLHDLLRAYASDVAERVDRARQRRAAARRMLDHYLHSAYAADRVLYPARHPIGLGAPATGVVADRPADTGEALAWFSTEHAVLLAVVEQAAAVSKVYAWQLVWSMATFLDRRGHWDDLAATQRLAVAATRLAGEPAAQADAHRSLARAYTRLGRLNDAHAELSHALDVYHRTGDQIGQANALLNMSLIWDRRARYEDALDLAQRSLDVFLATGDRHGQARALNAVGWYHALLGDHLRALGYCERALAQFQEFGDRSGQATTWDSLGYARQHLGDLAGALAGFRRSIDLFRDLGDRHLESMVLTHLGDSQETAGNPQAAREAWREALGILDDLHHPDADRIRTKLVGAGTPSVRVSTVVS
jgi:DNA-binding SARP family transcriptional activator